MNKWECDYPNCKTVAVGTGGAIGLMAVGWYFKDDVPIMSPFGRMPMLLCPGHHPHPIKCKQSNLLHCEMCAADKQANYLQEIIKHVLV